MSQLYQSLILFVARFHTCDHTPLLFTRILSDFILSNADLFVISKLKQWYRRISAFLPKNSGFVTRSDIIIRKRKHDGICDSTSWGNMQGILHKKRPSSRGPVRGDSLILLVGGVRWTKDSWSLFTSSHARGRESPSAPSFLFYPTFICVALPLISRRLWNTPTNWTQRQNKKEEAYRVSTSPLLYVSNRSSKSSWKPLEAETLVSSRRARLFLSRPRRAATR